jgi:uncharacterized 2Fe-2S/4Fe-4S cluster protein (DUF4445 family)
MRHFTVIFEPDGKHISIHAGATLLEAAAQAGIILNTVCGGKGICKKCAVTLEPDGAEVLACQHHVESDLTVSVPTGSRFFEQRILAEGIDTAGRIEPDIYRKYAEAEAATDIFGLAVDVGTTTVVARLVDMKTGQCLATEAALNPQTQYGDDVVSRIAYADTDAKLAELQSTIIRCVNDLIIRLCKTASIKAERICEVCIVGNTTMNHIFLKLPVVQLGQAPYKAYSLDAHDTAAGKLRLQMNPAGNIHTVENIAGFVGADTTAVALAVDIDAADDMTLVADIGTNGEIVLGTKDRLLAASCAAGPAFEGARITCGSRAVAGAIEAIVCDEEDIVLDVIGGTRPRSICGSGLIDAVAVLLNLGIIDATGRFAKPDSLKDKVPEAIVSRVREEGGQVVFVLDERQGTSGEQLVLTQQDIRQVQLAKAAVRAGIRLLEQKLGIVDSDIERIFLAGAFGNYIRPDSAVRIGLLPDVPLEKIHFVGNAASAGAQMILLSQDCRQKAGELARKIEYIEIAHEPTFQEVFADSMCF